MKQFLFVIAMIITTTCFSQTWGDDYIYKDLPAIQDIPLKTNSITIIGVDFDKALSTFLDFGLKIDVSSTNKSLGLIETALFTDNQGGRIIIFGRIKDSSLIITGKNIVDMAKLFGLPTTYIWCQHMTTKPPKWNNRFDNHFSIINDLAKSFRLPLAYKVNEKLEMQFRQVK